MDQIFKEFKAITLTTDFVKGDRLILFTDGISEAQNPQGTEFGVPPIIELMKMNYSLTLQQFVRSCGSKVQDFRAGEPSRDDLTLMVIERME